MKLNPTNPYGNTKIVIEKLIDDYSATNKDFKAISLRYFNPLGSSKEYDLPERPIGKPQNIMPVLLESIKEKYSKYLVMIIQQKMELEKEIIYI